MEEDGTSKCISLYEEAVKCLEDVVRHVTGDRCTDQNPTPALCRLYQCSELLTRLQQLDGNQLRKNALQQLAGSLITHQEVLLSRLGVVKNSEVNCHTQSSELPSDGQSRSRRLAIEDTIVEKGHVHFCDVAGLDDAKQALKEAIVMPVQFPQLFTGQRKPWKRILLYGPPGTGKSRLAQAVSSEISSAFYCVSSADLVSSWVGESEKLIKELFANATSQQGRSVIFIDEIDSICRQRSSREEEHTRRIKTELLKQMEGADNGANGDHIFVLCATNCPWELDSAFLRRFQKRIYIPLPDRAARKQLLQIHLGDTLTGLSPQDLELLAVDTEGYSGSDLAVITMEAMFEPIRDLQAATHWMVTEDGKYAPCDPNSTGTIRAQLTELPPGQVQPREMSVTDFQKSLRVNQQTVTQKELQKFAEFTASFGQHG